MDITNLMSIDSRMTSESDHGVDLAHLRKALRSLMEGVASAHTHRAIDDLCESLGFAIPPPGNKPHRGAAAVDDAADNRLVAAANQLLAGNHLSAPGRNRLQDILWAPLPAPSVVKRHRRDLARALDPEDLYLKLDPFDQLLDSLFVLNPNPLDQWVAGTSLHEQVRQHVYNFRGDWSVEELFERLGALEAGDARFALFLEGLVSPEVRPDETNQRALVFRMNQALSPAQVELRQTTERDGYPVYSLVRKHLSIQGRPKHLIFASKEKPDLRLVDALTGDVQIMSQADRVLVYEEPIGDEGLRWRDLERWWASHPGCDGDPKRSLYARLKFSLPTNSPPQLNLFVGFHKAFSNQIQELPALIPEVWLHWDPKSVHERGNRAFVQHRMDFLMLLPNGVRVVLEVDGKQHYASGDGTADPRRYAAMMKADRELKLYGYHVFRFGAADLASDKEPCIAEFFTALFKRFDVRTKP